MGASALQTFNKSPSRKSCVSIKPITMTMTNDQITEAVDAALKYAIELAEEEDGWKIEKEQGEATVKTKKNKDGRKVWLCTATVNVNPKLLFDKMKDVDNLTSWNTTLTQSKTLKTVSSDTKVTYQVTSEGGGGVSVIVDDQPEVKGIVRAVHGPGCQMVIDTGDSDKCKFVWLMDCDYKGMIPSSIIEIAMPSAQLQMIDCINKLTA